MATVSSRKASQSSSLMLLAMEKFASQSLTPPPGPDQIDLTRAEAIAALDTLGSTWGKSLFDSITPILANVDKLEGVWTTLDESEVFSGSVLSGARTLVRTRTALQSSQPLRRLAPSSLSGGFYPALTTRRRRPER